MGVASGAAGVIALALSNLGWAGLWLSASRTPQSVERDGGCSTEERCLDRLQAGARYQLVLELGSGLLALALGASAVLRLGRCRRRRSGAVGSEVLGVSVAVPAVEQAVSRRPAGVLSAASLHASSVVATAVAPDAPVSIDISTPRAAYVPRRLRQKSSSQ